jgi:hypothetical protein
MSEHKTAEKVFPRVALGTFLLILGLLFLIGNFTIIPGVGFWLFLPTIIVAVALFIQTYKVKA